MKHLISLLLCVLLLAGCTAEPPATDSSATERYPVEVTSVIDGDTIKVKMDGTEETVRYLLVDTPELNHPRLGKQPLGEEAKAFNRELLEAGEVSLEFDAGERFDDYGRLLAYVYADGESVQKQLLEAGLARVAYVFPPNTRHLELFEEAETEAEAQAIGIWQADGYVTDRGFDSAAAKGLPASAKGSPDAAADGCDIKGNINRQGQKIYHLPGGTNYEETNPEEWFCTEAEAREAGFRKSGH